jgi:signal transduction histidine kinase
VLLHVTVERLLQALQSASTNELALLETARSRCFRPKLRTDDARRQQILTNLVATGVRATKGNKVELKFEKRGRYVVLTTRCADPEGIEPIELTIVRRLCEILGGRLELDAQERTCTAVVRREMKSERATTP